MGPTHDFAPIRNHRPSKPKDEKMDKDIDSMNIERIDPKSYVYGMDSEALLLVNPSRSNCALVSNASRLGSFWSSGDRGVASGRSHIEGLKSEVFNRSEDLMTPVVLPITL